MLARIAAKVICSAVSRLIVLVILSQVLFQAGRDMRARHTADQRQAQLAQRELTNPAGRLPRHFIAIGFRPELIAFIEERFGLRTYPEAETKRLVQADRAYRRAESCHRRFSGNQMMPRTRLHKGGSLAESARRALTLRKPVLVFAEGHNTSMREGNSLAGDIYEIRLITPQQDLLVADFEERTLEDMPSIFNPYASVGQPPTLKEFIQAEMEGASR